MAGSPKEADRSSARWAFNREANLNRLRSERFDVVVIGGGITGAGVALDAASRGLSTALLDKADFASGTSSRSSKLVHGGIRYLQQREFRLVYQSLAERQRLLANAPHLVSVLPFLIPLFGRAGAVSRTVARSYSIALWLYDLTGGLRIGQAHQRVSRSQVLSHLPVLDTDRLVAGFVYFDAQADDARLTLAVLQTAVQHYGVAAANYLEAVDLPKVAGSTTGVSVKDREQPDAHSFEIGARVVVNATGVWTDHVRALGEADHESTMRPAKGVHITVPAGRFPTDIAAVIPVRKDRRSIFAVPWPEADLVYLGTTDTDYEGPLEDPRSTVDDVDYLIEAANAVSTAGLSRSDVCGVWAGLRPLLVPRKGHRLTERTADLSRRHSVWRDADGVITVTGGKLTTYRKMAEDTVDLVVRALGGSPRPCRTKSLRLEGAQGAMSTPGWTQSGPLHAHLARRFGSMAPAVLELTEGRPELLKPVVDGLPYIGAEVLYAARQEMALHLDDVLFRRTRAAMQDARASLRAAGAVADLMAEALGWGAPRRHAEMKRFVAQVNSELSAAGLSTTQAAVGTER